jgi:hypothetical protein
MKSPVQFTPVITAIPLFFGTTNAKLVAEGIATFSLPAGFTCPGADKCLARYDRNTKKIVDGPSADHRCYAATLEAARPSVQVSVDRNLAALKRARTRKNMVKLIRYSLPSRIYHTIRVHTNGDFFSETYFRAWLEVAEQEPERLFYAYTKSLHFWAKHRNRIPRNFILTASEGGKHDRLIARFNFRSAVVVLHPKVAELMGLEIDHDDRLPRNVSVQRFALLIHGQQKKGSEAAAAKLRLEREGVPHSYGKKSKTPAQRHVIPS